MELQQEINKIKVKISKATSMLAKLRWQRKLEALEKRLKNQLYTKGQCELNSTKVLKSDSDK